MNAAEGNNVGALTQSSGGGNNVGTPTRLSAAWLLKWGNHMIMTTFLFVLGLGCAIFAAEYITRGLRGNEALVTICMCLSAIITFVGYTIGFKLRMTAVMRKERLWYHILIGNIVAAITAITVAVTHDYKHDKDDNMLIGFSFLAVVVFAFMEMAKPTVDHGLLQVFLRLPLQTAILRYPHHPVGMHFVAAILLVFCTTWNAFMMQPFPAFPSSSKTTTSQQPVPTPIELS